jgi:hypothetical protein
MSRIIRNSKDIHSEHSSVKIDGKRRIIWRKEYDTEIRLLRNVVKRVIPETLRNTVMMVIAPI